MLCKILDTVRNGSHTYFCSACLFESHEISITDTPISTQHLCKHNASCNESTEVQTLGVIRIQLIYSINVLSKYSSLISHRPSIFEGRHIDHRSSKVNTSISEGRHICKILDYTVRNGVIHTSVLHVFLKATRLASQTHPSHVQELSPLVSTLAHRHLCM